MYEVASQIADEPIKSLASAVLEMAVDDYKAGCQAERDGIRSCMRDGFWLQFLDFEWTSDEMFDMIDSQLRKENNHG